MSGRGYGMREGPPSRSPASVPLRLERLSTASRSSFNSRFLSTLPLLSLYSPLHRGDDRAPFARGNAPPLGSICDDADACRNAKAGSNKVSREVSKPPGHERVRLRLGSRRAGRASILGELVGLGRCREEHGFEFVTEREKKKKKRKKLQFLKSLFFLSLEFLAAPLLAPPHKTTRPDTQKQVENGRGSRKASFEVSVQKRACLVPTSSRKVVERARQHFDENVELAAENLLLAHSRSAKEEEDESGKKKLDVLLRLPAPGHAILGQGLWHLAERRQRRLRLGAGRGDRRSVEAFVVDEPSPIDSCRVLCRRRREKPAPLSRRASCGRRRAGRAQRREG